MFHIYLAALPNFFSPYYQAIHSRNSPLPCVLTRTVQWCYYDIHRILFLGSTYDSHSCQNYTKSTAEYFDAIQILSHNSLSFH